MRHVLAFFALGALLFVGKQRLSALVAEPPRPLVVHVARGASAGEVERAIDEAVLLEEATVRGGLWLDPVVREELLKQMRNFSQDDDRNDIELLERARAMGLHQADPVVRRRLIFQAEQMWLGAAAEGEAPRVELEGYLERHRVRYERPSELSFVQVYLDPARTGQRDAAEAALQRALSSLDPGSPQVRSLSHPSLVPQRFAHVSQREVSKQLGGAFAAELFAQPAGQWQGPLTSPHGRHWVFVTERVDARLPPWSELRARLRHDYFFDRRDALLRERLSVLRARYSVQVRRVDT